MEEDNAEIVKVEKKEISINKRLFFGVIAGVVIVFIAFALLFFNPFKTQSTSTGSAPGAIVAKVNGQAIYQQDVQKIKDSLQTQSQIPVTDTDARERIIVKLALLQKAEEAGIKVTDAEAETKINQLIVQNGLTLEQFKAQLAAANVKYEDALSDYKESLEIEKLVTQEVGLKEIADSEAKDYYEKNKLLLFGNTTAPKYETIASQVKTLLQQQQSGDKIAAYVKSVRDAAEVEILG